MVMPQPFIPISMLGRGVYLRRKAAAAGLISVFYQRAGFFLKFVLSSSYTEILKTLFV